MFCLCGGSKGLGKALTNTHTQLDRLLAEAVLSDDEGVLPRELRAPLEGLLLDE